MHPVEPGCDVVPAAHGRHDVDDVLVEKVPAGHRLHAGAPLPENSPGEQAVHVSALEPDAEPAEQFRHCAPL